MKQDFREVLQLAAPPDVAWRTVSDIPTVLSWISIVGGVREVEPRRRYRVLLEDRLGPFKLRADVDVTVREREEGRRIRATGSGEDRQIGSRLVIEVELDVSARSGGSEVDLRGSYEVTGRPASLGAASIRKKASKILDEFFARARSEVG